MVPRRSITSLALLLCTASLSAHGGQYRGPTPGFGIPLPARPGGPVAPAGGGAPAPAPAPVRLPTAPAAPTAGTPTTGIPATGGISLAASTLNWETWWEFNKEPFLVSRIQGTAGPLTGSDDFYLGQRRASKLVDALQPTDKDRADRMVPALVRLLDAERNRDVQSACLIALGKIGLDGPGIDLEKVLAARIARDDQEVRETAVLALGIGGRPAALPMLAALLQDDADGRKLAERSQVRDRTRAFAAYGLGLLARRAADARLSQQVHDLLSPMLAQGDVKDRDLRTAVVTALGIMRADPTSSADKRLAWQTVEELDAWFALDLGAADEYVQAHAPIAIARLLGRGTSPVHQRCKQRFAEALDKRKRRGRAIQQSCALALGMLVVPEEQSALDADFSRALRQHYEDGHDESARQFSVIALGRIGGEANRTWMAKAYQRANKNSERPWVALALGLLAAPAARSGKPDKVLGGMLLDDLESASTDEQRSALAIAVGLTGYDAAAPAVMRMLRDNEGDERVAGHICISLGLLRDRAAVPMLSAVLERSQRRPFLLQQCAVALGCLGESATNDKLVAMLQKGDSVAVLAALAGAIGRIGDRRAIDSLGEMTADRELTKLSRAFVAAALGGVGDPAEMPWNVPISVDCNYTTQIDTLSNGQTGVLDIL